MGWDGSVFGFVFSWTVSFWSAIGAVTHDRLTNFSYGRLLVTGDSLFTDREVPGMTTLVKVNVEFQTSAA